MAEYPTLVGVDVDERLEDDYLVVPNTSSERRSYIPIGWLSPNVIANRNCSPGGSSGYSVSWLRQWTAFPCRAMLMATRGLYPSAAMVWR